MSTAIRMDHTRCGRCHRALSNEKSRRVGYGPVCLRKIGGKDDSTRNLMESMPRTIIDAAKAQESFSELTRRIFRVVGDGICACGLRLDDGKVGSHDHAGGIKLAGFGEKQWAYLMCSCGHCLAYHHISGLKYDDLEGSSNSFKAVAEV